ncbi:MAG: nucleotidyltransferase family protein [Hyphomicrobium sp.]|nr:nucleotidyltransferase family protein [Hyphomicrobium sp.]
MENKLFATFQGRPLLWHCLHTIRRLEFSEVHAVIGYQTKRIEAYLQHYAVNIVKNERFAEGLGTSLSTGIAALGDKVDASFVCLADMPLIEASVFSALSHAFKDDVNCDICVPIFEEQMGHPVLFGRRHFPILTAANGEGGARNLLAVNSELIRRVVVGSPSILRDYDTIEDFSSGDID